MKTIRNIEIVVLLLISVTINSFAQKNINILQLADTNKVFASNKAIGDLIDVKTYKTYLFKLNHATTAMQTVGFALRSGWCDTIGKQRYTGTVSWSDTVSRIATSYDISSKQNVSDTNSKDATRYWVNQRWTKTGNKIYPTTASDSIGIGITPTSKFQVDGAVLIGKAFKSNVTIDTVNGLRLNSNSIVWKDLEGNFNTGLSGGNTYPTYIADSGFYHFVVDSTGPTICKQYFDAIQINHEYIIGGTVFPHVHYKHTTTAGTPTFIIKYRWKNIDKATTSWKWCKLTVTTGTTNNFTEINYSTTGIPASGNGISALLQAQVYLLSQTGTGGIDAYSFDLHCGVDSLGSNSELSKD